MALVAEVLSKRWVGIDPDFHQDDSGRLSADNTQDSTPDLPDLSPEPSVEHSQAESD